MNLFLKNRNALVFLTFTAMLLLFTPSMASNRSESDKTAYSEPKPLAQWIQRGVECYGIVVFTFQDGTTLGQSIKTKVLLVSENQVRLRALESINLSLREGCGALGVNYGDTWWETETDDIFKTREQADQYLKQKGWLKK